MPSGCVSRHYCHSSISVTPRPDRSFSTFAQSTSGRSEARAGYRAPHPGPPSPCRGPAASAQPRRCKPLQGLRHRAPRQTAMAGDRAGVAALVEVEFKNLLHLSHRQPSLCHPISLGQIAEIRGVGRCPESHQDPPPRGLAISVREGGYHREIRQCGAGRRCAAGRSTGISGRNRSRPGRGRR